MNAQTQDTCAAVCQPQRNVLDFKQYCHIVEHGCYNMDLVSVLQ